MFGKETLYLVPHGIQVPGVFRRNSAEVLSCHVVVLPIHLGVDVDERMNKFLLDIPNVDHLEASWTLGSSRPRSLECLQWIQDLGPAAGDSCPRAGSSERRVSAVNRVQKPRLGRSTYGAYTHQLGHWTRGQCWQPCRRPCHTWSVWLRKLTELRLTCLLIKRFLVIPTCHVSDV